MFACALESKPTDCLTLWHLLPELQWTRLCNPSWRRLALQVRTLLKSLIEHFRSQQTDPHSSVQVLDVSQQLCALCHVIDMAPSLEEISRDRPHSLDAAAGRPCRVDCLKASSRSCHRSHISRRIVFSSPDAPAPSRARRRPLHSFFLPDLTHAPAIIEPYINLDVHGMLDNIIVWKERGAYGPAHCWCMRCSAWDYGRRSFTPRSVRSPGGTVDADTAQHARAAAGNGGTIAGSSGGVN